jgi:hypothetical protein
MLFERRTLLLLAIVALLGAPAVALRAACVGNSCRAREQPTREIPFCSLPPQTRSLIVAGFREERSPDVLALTGQQRVVGGTGLPRGASAWPQTAASDSGRVPIVFWGTGVNPSSQIPAGSGLRDVAPTIASVIGFHIPHPEVRSGRAVDGVATGDRPRLVVVVVWKGVGSADLEEAPARWPELNRLLEAGAGTLDGEVGSLPLDPAAALATLGTGGLPAEHGITGTVIRDGDRVVRAWSHRAPVSIIATLADDLDERLGQRPRIALVGTNGADRGAIGGNWYVRGDRDDVVIAAGAPMEQASAAARVVRSDYGADGVPDLLVVTMAGSIARMDAALPRMVRAAREAAGGSVSLVITATGSAGAAANGDVVAAQLRKEVERGLRARAPVIEAVGLGGLFLDQRALADTGITSEDVLRELRAMADPQKGPLLADAFPGIAVTLARYC